VGPTGNAGATGAEGIQGPFGITGSTGATGATGTFSPEAQNGPITIADNSSTNVLTGITDKSTILAYQLLRGGIYDLVWANLTNATAVGDQVTGTGAPGFTGFAWSNQYLAGGIGSISFTLDSGGGANRGMMGLSNATIIAGVNISASDNGIGYGIFNATAGTFQVTESTGVSSSQPFSGTWISGDVFTVSSDGTTVTYYQNGTLIYTSLRPEGGATLYPAASTYSTNRVNLTASIAVGGTQTGQLMISGDGANNASVVSSDSTVGVLGVSFTATSSGGSITLVATTTATGYDAFISYTPLFTST
jgi:hypothetical protein